LKKAARDKPDQGQFGKFDQFEMIISVFIAFKKGFRMIAPF
jgi:hypothetical protein